MIHFEYCPLFGLKWWVFEKPIIKHTFDNRVRYDKKTFLKGARRENTKKK